MVRSRVGRGWAAAVAGCALLVTTMGSGVAAAGGGPLPSAPSPDDTVVSEEVLADIEERGRADYWVRFNARPDLGSLQQNSDWDARGQAVYDALTATAENSQADLRADLDAAGLTYTTYAITNAVLVRAGDEAAVHAAAALPGVDGIYPTQTYEPPDHRPGELDAAGPLATEWGISDIKADQVWSDLGVLGEDVVVANLDTGVQFDHPALVNAYRGNNGDGTFTHDYNWFDGGGFSPDEPADPDGHGTHTAGTMVGDDGGDNQIGVAPAARWIAAGTDWTDESLFAAGEWFLAPTDLSGANPDPAMRPHIVNNSWGVPGSTDPFMEDILEAWEASGMFGVWAAGNEGEFGCETLRTPPLMQMTYATGAYDSSREISVFSSRGPGENGETKPNIAAPGEGVRSSVPGNAYDVSSGTSMAAPHLAGSIALMWSASPAMIGDVAGTKELLDETASDAPDLECGGTEDDNNVYGEGRLDALELVLAAPVGDVGTVEGTITDAATGDPIPAVRVSLDGPQTRTVVTGADGTYRARVMAGDYAVTAEKFGWVTGSSTVTVPVDGTATLDLELDAAPTGALSGTVTDGSGHGFPLYARVSVSGTTLFTYTDPVDGTYHLDIPLDTYVQIIVDAQYPGYHQGFREAQLSGDSVEDFALPVDVISCVANGYTPHHDGPTETFDEITAPPGWTVEDNIGNDQVWVFEDLNFWGNMTGGEGGFATVDSDYYGPEGQQDTSLVSPSFDLSGMSNPMLTFRHFYVPTGDRADVDVSHDGGATWSTIYTAGLAEGVQEFLEVPVADDMSDVRVRFHYYEAAWNWMWQVDEVFVGNYACLPDQPGGYVVGNVHSTLTGDPVRGASVTSVEAPADRAITVDTPADVNQDDGFYWLFSTLTGTNPFEATARRMGTQVQDVDVPADGAVRADFQLGAAQLEVDPEQIDTEVVLGEADTVDLTVTNTGDGAAEVELREVAGGFEMLRADGTRIDTSDLGPGAPLRTVDAEVSVSALSGGAPATDPAQRQPAGPAEEPWTDLTSYPMGVIDNRVVNLDGDWFSIGGTDGFEGFADVYRYDAASMSWAAVAPLPEAAWATTAGVVGGQIVVSGGWRLDGNTSPATWTYDAAGDAWSPVADNPSAVSGAGQAVVDGLFYSVGGCTTGFCDPVTTAVTAYDVEADEWLELADYPVAAAFPSCGGVEGVVVCTGGTSEMGELSASYSYDPASDSWTEVAEAPAPWWASSYAVANGMLVVTGGVVDGEISNEALGYDPAADEWVDLPNPNTPAYRGGAACGFVRVGGDLGDWSPTEAVEHLPGFDDCGAAGADVDWLSLSETLTVLEPGESWTVEVTTDGAVPQPGTYTAGIQVVGGLPGTDPLVPVTMEVLPPAAWGKLMGTVSEESCEGDLSPLPAAAVTLVPTDGGDPRWYLVTDEAGEYARWIDTRVGELEITAFKEGYYPESVIRPIPRGMVTQQDFDLLDAECEAPGPIHPDVLRLAGADRYETAVAVSSHYDPGLDTVFLATGLDFPDALTGSAAAGSADSPVLLTRSDTLVQATAGELRRLDPDRVVVLGGPLAISNAVLRDVEDATGADVVRWAGANRYETAAVISESFESADVVYVATGADFPDALAGSARAGALDAPVLLVRPDVVPNSTIAELERLAPDTIRLLGGEEAISTEVATALGDYGTVERLAGGDRYETATLISADHPTSRFAFVSNGTAWPDAVTGSALAARWEAPLLLVKEDTVPVVTWDELDRLDPETVHALGGPLVIAEEVLDRLRTLE